jgi:hypothetical protein
MGKYFGLGDDWGDLTAGWTSGGTKARAGLKILGKVIANVGTFAVTEVVPGIIESGGRQAAKHLEKNRSQMTDEQIENAERLAQNGQDVGRRRHEAWEIDHKVERLRAEMESHPDDERLHEELSAQIAELEAQKPKWYDSNA